MSNALPPAHTPLPDLAVVQFQGADAVTFLQGQLSNDIVNMPPDQARLAGYCSAKGRVLATLVVWREAQDAGDTCYALVQADVADALVKRLSMFVLRAKVAIRVAARSVTGQILPAAQDTPPAWTISRHDGYVTIQAPNADPAHGRRWCIGAAVQTVAADATDVQPPPDAADATHRTQAWRAADIAAGLPWIGAANQDLYIPQTLNLDLLGAISFTKGCFPGQEVVARSHYRGTLKRRMVYGTVAAQTQAVVGMDLFNAKGGDHPCGRVINLASAAPEALQHLLLEVQLADLPDADFRLGGVDGAAVTLGTLPYALWPSDDG